MMLFSLLHVPLGVMEGALWGVLYNKTFPLYQTPLNMVFDDEYMLVCYSSIVDGSSCSKFVVVGSFPLVYLLGSPCPSVQTTRQLNWPPTLVKVHQSRLSSCRRIIMNDNEQNNIQFPYKYTFSWDIIKLNKNQTHNITTQTNPNASIHTAIPSLRRPFSIPIPPLRKQPTLISLLLPTLPPRRHSRIQRVPLLRRQPAEQHGRLAGLSTLAGHGRGDVFFFGGGGRGRSRG